MRNLRSRFAFANVVALLALFISLSAGVYAASKISGKQIKRSSIAGKKLKPDTLTGAQISEGTLGPVPTAATAATAATAGDAQALQGSGPGAFVAAGDIRRLSLDATQPAGSQATQQSLLQLGPLELAARCEKGTFTLTALSTASGARWDIGGVRDANVANDGGPLTASPTPILADAATNATHRTAGNLILSDPTMTISVPFIAFIADQSPGATRCFMSGTATRAAG